jgi:DNA-directed RNA polymerase specialized sigma24 family protein
MEEKMQALQTLYDMQTKDAREYLFKLANDGYVQEDIRHKALELAIRMGKYLDGKSDLPMPKD